MTCCQVEVTSHMNNPLEQSCWAGALNMYKKGVSQSQTTLAGVPLPKSCKEVCSVLPAAQHQDAETACHHTCAHRPNPHDKPIEVRHPPTSCTHLEHIPSRHDCASRHRHSHLPSTGALSHCAWRTTAQRVTLRQKQGCLSTCYQGHT